MESQVGVGQGTRGLPSPPLPPLQPSSPPSPSPHSYPVDGRIRHHLPHWLSITKDRWVLQIVQKGCSRPIESAPPARPPSFSHLPEDHLALLCQEVTTLLAKGAIEKVPVPEVGCGCYSSYFLVPKKDKGLRPILDLRDLNYFLKEDKFKMLFLAQVLSALDPGDWMVVLDLQDAYFHILHPPCPQTLPTIRGRSRAHSVYRAPLRLYQRPSGVRKSDGGGCSSSAQVRGVSRPLPRRLAVEGGLTPESRLPPSDYGEPPAHAGVHYKRAEVTLDSLSNAPLHRSCSGHSAVSGLSSQKASLRHSGYDSDLPALVLGFCETDSEAAGPHGLLHPASHTCQMAYAGSAVGLEVPVGAASGESLRHGSDLGGDCERPAVVAFESALGPHQIPLPSPTRSFYSDRCVTSVLGRHMGEVEIRSFWSPVESGLHINFWELQAIRLALKAFLPSLKGRCSWTILPLCGTATNRAEQSPGPFVRRHHASGHGWNIRALPWWLKIWWVLSRQSGLTQPSKHSRLRMVSPSGGGARTLLAVGRALVRSVCLSRERAMSAVLHVRVSKAALARRRFSSQVELRSPLRFPAYTTSAQSSQEDRERPGPSHLGGSGLGTESLVSRAFEHVHRSSTQTASSSGSSVTATGDGFHPNLSNLRLRALRLNGDS
ncbi:hypothetical protein NDU88_005590 [Pleurodeles waltl]|uniref:Reverse transcriptase domain-containing protein n=1 Tax=Pleurodeles waltl TaxID=8319 RepID=A0AAV7PJ05_PLEWA|nr:hypothetical protein NDU88_005590 [Pleurodeles waltl]